MALLTQVITGFLGAGKTTLITALLAARPAGERWAVLVNEFGQIGIDQTAWAGDDVVVQEVPGGCICCAQNLPMQIALGRIAQMAGIDRLLVEPTGLGHPAQILATLREPHWQPLLQVGATVCVIDARQLPDQRMTSHDTFQAQVAVADVLVFSKADLLDAGDRERALAFAGSLQPAKALTVFADPAHVDAAWLDVAPRAQPVRRRSLLHLAPTHATSASVEVVPQTPPYHYHEQALEHEVGGWILPADWCFRHDDLLTLLLSWQGLARMKGVFHTDRGWISVNITPADCGIRSSEYRADNRVELISPDPRDWAGDEASLLALLAPAQGAGDDQHQSAQQQHRQHAEALPGGQA